MDLRQVCEKGEFVEPQLITVDSALNWVFNIIPGKDFSKFGHLFICLGPGAALSPASEQGITKSRLVVIN